VACDAAAYSASAKRSEHEHRNYNWGYTAMTQARLSMTLILLLLCMGSADAAVPSEKINPSLVFNIEGPINHPYLVLYLSTRYFPTESDVLLAVLPLRNYRIVSGFTEALMTRPACTSPGPEADLWYSVRITEHDERRTQRCVLPQRLACNYFAAILQLPDINWSAQNLVLIKHFMSEVQCQNGLTIGDGNKGKTK